MYGLAETINIVNTVRINRENNIWFVSYVMFTLISQMAKHIPRYHYIVLAVFLIKICYKQEYKSKYSLKKFIY